jgi:hypothetical protein
MVPTHHCRHIRGAGKSSARKVVPYARSCVWGGHQACECCLMMTCSVCLNEATTAHPHCMPIVTQGPHGPVAAMRAVCTHNMRVPQALDAFRGSAGSHAHTRWPETCKYVHGWYTRCRIVCAINAAGSAFTRWCTACDSGADPDDSEVAALAAAHDDLEVTAHRVSTECRRAQRYVVV